jgi:hypothetical protein
MANLKEALGTCLRQASAFFHLIKGIEDAMDEIPDNDHIWGEAQDELVTAIEALNL